jgi:hypothetical protein
VQPMEVQGGKDSDAVWWFVNGKVDDEPHGNLYPPLKPLVVRVMATTRWPAIETAEGREAFLSTSVIAPAFRR